MKKSDVNAVEPAKSELEAPVQLTPEQLETVAAGFRSALVSGNLVNLIKIVAGNWPVGPILTKGLPGGGMSF